MDQTSSIPSFFAPQPAAQVGLGAKTMPSAGAGAISGGLLRPGAIDQPQFQAMLQAAQAAQRGGPSPQSPPDTGSIVNGIPTLTPAQFAVLAGGQTVPSGQPPVVEPDPTAEPVAPPMLVSGIPTTAVPAKVEEPAAASAAEPEAAQAETAQASAAADPRVVHFKHMPDKDERRALAASGKRWVVDETPGSRKLFFGDDEVFGWDDFVDLINPLQHIPVVAQIYRAISGDEIGGAASLLGAVPFGPSGMMSAVADLAVRDVTGTDIGNNVIAMLFGADEAPTDVVQAAASDIPSNTQWSPASSRNVDRDNGNRNA